MTLVLLYIADNAVPILGVCAVIVAVSLAVYLLSVAP